MVKIEYKFDLYDRVEIVDIKANGIVIGLMSDSSSNQYQVLYWINGERKTEWLYSFEVSKIEQEG